MEIVYKNCCGLDVHKKTVVACFVEGRKKETLSFGTMTDGLLEVKVTGTGEGRLFLLSLVPGICLYAKRIAVFYAFVILSY